MTSKTFARLEPWKSPYPKCPIRSKNIDSRNLARCHFCPRSDDTRSCQRNYSSQIVRSPFPAGEIPKIFVHELMLDIVDKFPEATALRCALTGRSYRYGEIHVLSQRFMNSLIKDGFSYKETIAIILPNCPEFPVIIMGALAADMTVTLMSHNYTSVSGVGQLPDVLTAVENLEAATQSKQIRRIIAMDIPSPDSLPEGVARFSEAIADNVDHSRKTSNKATLSDVAIMPYSSGTTGLAKGVCLSHKNVVSSMQQISLSGYDSLGPDSDQDLVLGLLPFYHIYGFLIMNNALGKGCQMITLPGFRPEHFIHTLANQKISMLNLVPPIILFMGAHPAIESKHLAHVRIVITGADSIEARPLEILQTKLPPKCKLAQGYGLTETSGFALFPTFPVKNFATVGAPAALTEAKVLCTKTGKTLGPNETGELCFRGPQIMVGYNNNPQATAEMICEDGWMRTGDIGYYDEDDHFYIEGRLKELIKVKGFQVPPAELEAVLRTIPGVGDVGVIGVPDTASGETPIAYIVKAPGSTLTEEQIIKFLSGKVAAYKVVSRVIFVDTIPKSPSGKILRKNLQEWYDDFNNYKNKN